MVIYDNHKTVHPGRVAPKDKNDRNGRRPALRHPCRTDLPPVEAEPSSA